MTWNSLEIQKYSHDSPDVLSQCFQWLTLLTYFAGSKLLLTITNHNDLFYQSLELCFLHAYLKINSKTHWILFWVQGWRPWPLGHHMVEVKGRSGGRLSLLPKELFLGTGVFILEQISELLDRAKCKFQSHTILDTNFGSATYQLGKFYNCSVSPTFSYVKWGKQYLLSHTIVVKFK